MSDSRPKLVPMLLVALVITWAVTGLRLYGELENWDPKFFSKEPGGGMALVGMSWLPIVIGLWFGFVLKRSGSPVSLGRAAILYVVGLAVFAGGMFGLIQADLIKIPSLEAPGSFVGTEYMLAAMGVAAIVGLIAWPKLTLWLMIYGILARLPIVLITWLDIDKGWDTHYGEGPPGLVVADNTELFYGLIMAQVTFWPFVFTPIVGGLFGCIGAAMARKK